MVRLITLVSIGIICSAVWLGLLIVTGFAAVPVCAGLLGALFLTGASSRPNRSTE